MSIPSRRVALTLLALAGVLGIAVAAIVRQTSTPPPAKSDGTAPTPGVTDPAPSARHDAAPSPAPAPAAAGDASNGDGTDVDAERALALEVRSLVASGQIGKARARANAYYARFPSGPAALELQRLTGAHPTRDATGTRP
jgi:hypothetical protein